MRPPTGQVRVDEDQDVAGGDELRLPQRLALAEVAAEVRSDSPGGIKPRAVREGDPRGRVGGVGVDHDELVDQLQTVDQFGANARHDCADRRRLVAGRDDDTDPKRALRLEQRLLRPVRPPQGRRRDPRVHAC
jgi:hypothetical protein